MSGVTHKADLVAIPRPRITTGPKGMTDDEATVMYLRDAAIRVREQRYWGSGVTRLVSDLLDHVAEAVEHSALPEPAEPFRPWCSDCGPGYRIGDEGCRHTRDYRPEVGETGICRTCAQPIWWETGEAGYRERLGWSDRLKRGGDSLVCFKAVDYRHVPMGAREAAIYRAGVKVGQEADRG